MILLANQSLPALPFVVCAADGAILRAGTAPAQMIAAQAQEGECVFAGVADANTHYVDVATGSLCLRMAMMPVITGTSIANLPDPCTVTTESICEVVVGGAVTLSYTVPGTYKVTVTAAHYQPCDLEVTQP